MAKPYSRDLGDRVIEAGKTSKMSHWVTGRYAISGSVAVG